MNDDAEPRGEKWPAGFLLLVGAAAIYLGWRLIQGIVWLVDWVRG